MEWSGECLRRTGNKCPPPLPSKAFSWLFPHCLFLGQNSFPSKSLHIQPTFIEHLICANAFKSPMVWGTVNKIRRQWNQELWNIMRSDQELVSRDTGTICLILKNFHIGCDKAISCCFTFTPTSYINSFEPQWCRQGRNYYSHFRDGETEAQKQKNIGLEWRNQGSGSNKANYTSIRTLPPHLPTPPSLLTRSRFSFPAMTSSIPQLGSCTLGEASGLGCSLWIAHWC